jgi:hypothetical protein
MQTGKHLKIKQFGDAVSGVILEGNPAKPEPIHFRVVLPFGDVDIVRCTDNSYWVHVRTNTVEDTIAVDTRKVGKFVDARIDLTNEHADNSRAIQFQDPNMNHLAVRIDKS